MSRQAGDPSAPATASQGASASAPRAVPHPLPPGAVGAGVLEEGARPGPQPAMDRDPGQVPHPGPTRRRGHGEEFQCRTCGPAPRPRMLRYDTLRGSPLFEVDMSIFLPDLWALYLVTGLLSSSSHAHTTEVLGSVLPFTTACLGSHVTVGARVSGNPFQSAPAHHLPQAVASLHIMLLAPSGSGKSTLVNELLARLSSVFATTSGEGGAVRPGPGIHTGSSAAALLAHLKSSGGCSLSVSDESFSLYHDYFGKAHRGGGGGDADAFNK